MRLQFPFVQLVRHQRMAQHEFVARAAAILGARDDCLHEASDQGLTLLARSEEALRAARQVLLEVYGAELALDPVGVRRAPGAAAPEPIMHVRIDAPLASAAPLRAMFARRRIAPLEDDAVHGRAILRGEGPAAHMLGLGEELAALAGASAQLWVALARYAPAETDDVGAGDGNRTHV